MEEDQVTEPTGEVTPAQTFAPAETPSDNPAWASHLEKFPEGMRGLARDSFAEFDKGVQSQFEKIHQQYAPYKPFLENKVDPQRLIDAYNFALNLEQDPVGTTKLLAQQLGISLAEAQQVVDEAQQEGDEDENVDPRYQQLEQNFQNLSEFIQQQEQQRIAQEQQAQLDAELDSGFAEIESQIGGKLPDLVKNQVLQQMLYMSSMQNRAVTVQEAFAEVNKFVEQIRQQPRPGATAPRVTPSGGSIPVSPPDGKTLGQLSPSERKKLAGAVVSRQVLGNAG